MLGSTMQTLAWDEGSRTERKAKKNGLGPFSTVKVCAIM